MHSHSKHDVQMLVDLSFVCIVKLHAANKQLMRFSLDAITHRCTMYKTAGVMMCSQNRFYNMFVI